MPEGRADDLDVHRPERLLARGQPARRRLLLATEVGLEGLHARRGEQNRRVVAARHERRRGHAKMAVLLEERQKPLPDLGSLHRRWSLGVGRGRPTRAEHRDSARFKAGDAAATPRAGPPSLQFPSSSGRSCSPLLQLFAAKGVHCMCTHASRAHIRRRCRSTCCWLSSLWGKPARVARGRWTRANALSWRSSRPCTASPRRPDRAVLAVGARRQPAARSPACCSATRGLAGPLRVRRAASSSRSSSSSSRCCSCARCPMCRC